MVHAARGNGLVDRIARTWSAPRAAVRDELATADEARLLFYAVAGSMLFTLSAIGAQALNPGAREAADFRLWVTTQVVVGTFFRPIGLYLSAGVIGLFCRWAGGVGDWRATRAAVFWTAFAAAPAALALAVIGALASGPGGAPDAVAAAGRSAGAVLWAVLLAPGLAEAHGFRSAAPVFGAFALVAALAVALSVSA